MAKTKTFKQKVELYQKLYGEVPEDYDTRMKVLTEMLKFREKEIPFLSSMHEKLTNMKTEKLRFILYLVPEPTPRPRTRFNTKRFYVKGAKDNNDLFGEIMKSMEDMYLITTATKVKVINYLPTPSGMNRYERFFAELGLTKALTTPDWDNLAKAYCDMIQKNLLINDSLIWKGTSVKYYSIKPRIDLTIEYDKAYDCKFNRKKIEDSKYFKEEDSARFNNALDTVLKLK